MAGAKKKQTTAPDGTESGSGSVSLPVLNGAACRGKHLTIRRSKSGPRRAIVLAIVQLLMIIHLIQWAITGRTVSPIEPSESMEFVKQGVVNAGAVFFALALLSTLLLGRWFCGWGCHVVMLQDLCGWMMKKIGIRPKPFRSRLLVYVPFILAVYMFLWPAIYRWGLLPISERLHDLNASIPALNPAPVWTGISSGVVTDEFWQTFPSWIIAIPFLAICGFATVYFLGAKGFCTYGCPYGGFFAPLEQYSRARIRVTDACEQCGHCTAVCTSNVRVHEEVHAYGMVVDPGCMKCLDCVSVCPNDALYFGFGKTAAGKGKPRGAAPKTRADLSWPEEIACAIVFFLAFTSVRGVYGIVPMLMAAGMAGCITWIAWKFWRVLRDQNANFHRFRLRYHGKLTPSGMGFLVLGGLVLLLTAHSGLVRTAYAAADRADRRVTIPKLTVFTPNAIEMSPDMTRDADAAIRWYELADTIGYGGIALLPYRDVDVRTAWLYACKRDLAEAERRLRRHLERFGPNEAVSSDLGLLYFTQMRELAGEEYYRKTIAEHPDYLQMHGDLLMWFESEGRLDEAIASAEEMLERHPEDSPAYLLTLRRLSLLELSAGNLDRGIELVEETIELDDQNPAAFMTLAQAYERRGDRDAAIDALTRAIALVPDDPDLHRQIAALLDSAGRFAEAAHHIEEAERLTPPAQ